MKKIIAMILNVALLAVIVLFLCCPTVKAEAPACYQMNGQMLMDANFGHAGCAGGGTILSQLWLVLPENVVNLVIALGLLSVLIVIFKILFKVWRLRENLPYFYYKDYARGFVPWVRMRIIFNLISQRIGETTLLA